MNELCLLSGSYILIEFTEYEIDAVFRYTVGWVLLGIMSLTLFGNMSIIIVKAVGALVAKIKTILRNKRVKVYQVGKDDYEINNYNM